MNGTDGPAPAAALVASLSRVVPNFPAPGICFRDLSPVFADADGLAAITDELARIADGADLIAGVDARGFLVAGAVATRLGLGALPVRKGGKLPPPVIVETYELEYGTGTLEIAVGGIELSDRRIVVIDDVLATGGTLAAACRLLRRAGATVSATAVVLELEGLGGRAAIESTPVHSVLRV